jgi:hypothetical protein
MRAAALLALIAILPLAAACGDGGGAQPMSTAVVSPATPAPSMTSAPPPATSTPFPSTPPAPYLGPAHELGRDDCPSDWLAWVSQPTGFSICYPPSWKQYTGYPWYAQTGITLPQEGSLDAAHVAVSYVTNYTGGPWFECDKPESVELLGHAGKLCVWGSGADPVGSGHTPLIIEAYAFYVPYDHYSLEVMVILYGRLKPDAGPECFFTPPAGFRGGAFVPPESCMNRSYDPEVKSTAFDIFATLRGP